ncbi:Glutathione peroxidase family protein [Paramagnetospirillum magnetotacticum MS-1]|uniref:Glutathione peroxidase n=1 Tax=Paramagnetospirillum magnetotacticum MS-1 TaxID=272627 RepID=A0A0C2YVU6_PARME|nr:glutathione peroxidase [Paramagnetospirillum magnetotacticum]KIL99238.1 Glutathione peroxidase family protein [Paramagnetospirillum magnetotacticum MS-1]
MSRLLPTNPLGSFVASVVAAIGLAGGVAWGATGDHLDWSSLPLPAIAGGQVPADAFKGKVVLVVNTASQCGFTPQYQGLEALWREYRGRGLVVLGVPSNDFGAQEPGSNPEVASFCEINYGVDFPLLEKQVVTGTGAHPFYRWAAERTGALGVPRWNFHKILVGRDGQLVDWFASTTAPDSARLRAAIDKALTP